ncbi:MAG TPA: hypothetical protein VH934_04780 [Xanthobacteraceae bacterium]
MLQKLTHHIANCLERAADCRRRAEQMGDPAMKADLLDIEARWTHLAQSYEFVESLERFLLSAHKQTDARSSAK